MSDTAADDDEAESALFRPSRPTYRLTRFLLLRALGLVYLVAFLSLADQIVPLIGEHGLLPARAWLETHDERLPTLFELGVSDGALLGAAWIGAVLALAVVLGATNALLMLALWAIQLSFAAIGQVFLGYGWEILLAEAGFLAIFLCPIRDVRPFPKGEGASPIVIGLFRWLLLRLMLGAGLIKLRGDSCWRDLTCLDFHYETQPLPSPLSWLWHGLPAPMLHGGVLFNHFVELVVPFGVFGPRRLRLASGIIIIAFQLFLALSGNLSYLNWLTIAVAIACFDDGHLARVLRRVPSVVHEPPSRAATTVPIVLAIVVGILSVGPVVNMLSPDQLMNASFDPLHLVNTYGAFGSVNRVRRELVIEGTHDADPASAHWRAYALPCQPGPIDRRPCFVAPWPLRLDWQIWFAAMSEPERQPWLVHLVWQILRGDRDVLRLFAYVPFPSRDPPRLVRIVRWRYRFTGSGESGWWRRDRDEEWMRPVSTDDEMLVDYVRHYGWEP